MSDIRIATPAFFEFPFSWIIFFHPLTFSQYVFWCLKWVSCRQHIFGFCFYIHSANLCLLAGTFNPFKFKIFIDIYIFLWSLSLLFVAYFCRSFPSLLFPDHISPFTICCKGGLVVLNSLIFCFSVKLLTSLSILNEIFAGRVILIVDVFLSVL